MKKIIHAPSTPAPGYIKYAVYRNLPGPVMGPEQISHALAEFERLRRVSAPDDRTLSRHGLSPIQYDRALDRLLRRSDPRDEKLNLSEAAPKPALHAVLGGLIGAGSGLGVSLAGRGDALAHGAWMGGGALAGTGAGYLHGRARRNQFRSMAEVLRRYGVTKPATLHRAAPLLAAYTQ